MAAALFVGVIVFISFVVAVAAGRGDSDEATQRFFADAEANGWYVTSGGGFVRLDENLDYSYLPKPEFAEVERVDSPIETEHLGGLAISLDRSAMAATMSPYDMPDEPPALMIVDANLNTIYRRNGPTTGSPDSPYRWSPDGTRLSYANGNGIFVLDVALDSTVQVANNHAETVRDGQPYGTPSWSADGTRLVYQTVDKEIAIVTIATGDVEVIADGRLPSWSPDGTTIVYHSTGLNPKAVAYDVESGDTDSLFRIENGFSSPFIWTPDSNYFVFVTPIATSVYSPIRIYDFETDVVGEPDIQMATVSGSIISALHPDFENRLRLYADNETSNPNRRETD